MVFPRTLTPKGTGLPDFSTGVQQVAGSLGVYGVRGSIRAYGSVVVAGYIAEIGTLRRVGTVRYVQAGSLGRVARVGTLGRITSVGSIRNIVAGQDIMTAVDAQARLLSGTVMRDRRPLGPGSVWTGSWQSIANYRNKTYLARCIGTPGSFAIIIGMTGTGIANVTGTYYGPVRIGAGSFKSLSFRETYSYTRPYLQSMGAAQNARGSFTVALTRQV